MARTNMKRKRKHIRRRLEIWHGVAALLLLLFVLFRISGGYKLKKRLQALQNQGHPVTLEDLERSYSMPAGEKNAADVYLAAFSNYEKWDRDAMRGIPIAGRASLPARTEPLDTPTRQLVDKFLSDNEQALSLLYEAASIEHCRYPDDFTQVSNRIKYRRYGMGNDVQVAAQLLRLESLIASENEDVDRFLDSISTSLALARSLSGGPLMIHRSTHDTVLNRTYRSIERAINRTPLTDEQLLRLSALVKESDDNKGFKRALLAEQCLGLHKFIAPLKEVSKRIGEQENSQTRALIISRMLGLNSKHALGYIDLMQKSIDALELPYADRLIAFEAVRESAPRNKQGRIIRDVLTLEQEIDRQARARVTRAGLAVERYRLAEGNLPKSLDNLIPAFMQVVPEDPFNGENLRYRRLKAGFVVYSVNEDLSDNGGAEIDTERRDPSGSKLLPWDITFIVER